MRPAPVPTGFDTSILEGLSHEELIALVEEVVGGGITVNFSGKANATRIAPEGSTTGCAPDQDAQRGRRDGTGVERPR